MTTGSPYFGFTMPPPQPTLATVQQFALEGHPRSERWLRRLGVTHLVSDRPVASNIGTEIWSGRDPAMDVLAHRDTGIENPRKWRIVRLPQPFPPVRLARYLEWIDSPDLMRWRLSAREGRDIALTLDAELARSAERSYGMYPGTEPPDLISWEGRKAVVNYDGRCVIVIARTYYPGWTYRVNNGPPRPVSKMEIGLQGVLLGGHGPDQVTLHYQPTWFRGYAVCSMVSLFAALAMAFGGPWGHVLRILPRP
jgi:hypothetical protein